MLLAGLRFVGVCRAAIPLCASERPGSELPSSASPARYKFAPDVWDEVRAEVLKRPHAGPKRARLTGMARLEHARSRSAFNPRTVAYADFNMLFESSSLNEAGRIFSY